jgi:hypothetical protein
VSGSKTVRQWKVTGPAKHRRMCSASCDGCPDGAVGRRGKEIWIQDGRSDPSFAQLTVAARAAGSKQILTAFWISACNLRGTEIAGLLLPRTQELPYGRNLWRGEG